MSARYLLDTDWVIHYLNAHPGIVQRVDAYRSDGIGVSIATVAELYEGIYGSTDPQATEQTVQQFLKGVPTLSIDEAVARRFGRERERLRTAGQLIGDVDLFIGATALTNDLTLLTNNRRHFERLQGLLIESL
ncbi:MAG: type II toxin-antitoxin system VapC family toxin [Candidatus Binatia bacterium]